MKRRTFHGSRVGAVARTVWVCSQCGLWVPEKQKPAQCGGCHSIEFEYFHSRAEAKRWAQLLLLVKSRKIVSLQRQPEFELHAWAPEMSKKEKVGKYIADFSYIGEERQTVYEDVKGAHTPLSKWKIKHCELEYGIKIILM